MTTDTRSLFQHRSEVLGTHELRPDPTHELSHGYRETCLVCGSAAIQMPGGPVYGSASKDTCAERVAMLAEVR